MSKAAEAEIATMAHLAKTVDSCRPIDRLRVAQLVEAGVELQRTLGDEAAVRVCNWLSVRAKVDTDEALHTAELRRQARAAEANPGAATGGPDEPAPPLFDCDLPGHVGCTRRAEPTDDDDGIDHRLTA